MDSQERSVATANALISVLVAQRNEAMDRFTDAQAQLLVMKQELASTQELVAKLSATPKDTAAGE